MKASKVDMHVDPLYCEITIVVGRKAIHVRLLLINVL